MTGRGKASENTLTEALYQLGVTASKLMQGKHDEVESVA